MKKLMFALLFCFTPLVISAAPLKVVNLSAPAINCVFNPTCTVTVNDTRQHCDEHFLQSRTYKGAVGSPAAGLFAYDVHQTNCYFHQLDS